MNPDSTTLSGTTTNLEEMFELKHQAEGEKLLSVSFIGYEKSVITVGALYGDEAIEIRLQPSVFSLNGVTIQARSVIVRDDRKMILTSQEQIRTATDATDMLRKKFHHSHHKHNGLCCQIEFQPELRQTI